MEFFTKLGKKASETYQITKEKATTLSEELKLKGKISDAKEKIDDLYKEIGNIVYEEIKANQDVSRDIITQKCDKISELKAQIEKYEKEILTLKKIKKCENCGADLEIDAEFCSKCGKEQPKIEKVEVKEESDEQVNQAEVAEVKDVEENSEENKE